MADTYVYICSHTWYSNHIQSRSKAGTDVNPTSLVWVKGVKKSAGGWLGGEEVRKGGTSVLGGRVTKTQAESKNKVHH